MAAGGAIEEGRVAWKMSPTCSSNKLLRKLSRVALGLALGALIVVGALLRMDVPHTWPSLFDTTVHIAASSPHLKQLTAHDEHLIYYSDYDLACMSRAQQNKYRKKESHYPMSQSLAQALGKYMELHSQCALSEGVDEVKTGCHYLVYYEGYEGLGNRLLSLVSAFAYALVTRRVLVIDSRRGHLAQLLCEPFQNSSWLLPSRFGDRVVQQAVTLEDATSHQFMNVASVRVNLRHEQTLGDQKFLCAESQQGLENVTWLVWESNQYYVPRLFMIPEFWSTLHPLFPDITLVFTQLSRFLCLPCNSVWNRIRHIQDSYLASSKVQVGIQVRRHGVPDDASFSASVHKLIMDCLLDHQILPKLQSSTGQSPRLQYRGGHGRAPTLAVLVTSLQTYYYDRLLESYIDEETEDGSVVRFHMVSHEGTEQYSYDQAAKALVEMWLLSFCDKLATSSWSTFGYVAQALGGIHPYILNIRGNSPEQDGLPPCSIAQSREPCLHYPYVVKCPTTAPPTEQHTDWVARHVKPCQDETRGLQLCSS